MIGHSAVAMSAAACLVPIRPGMLNERIILKLTAVTDAQQAVPFEMRDTYLVASQWDMLQDFCSRYTNYSLRGRQQPSKLVLYITQLTSLVRIIGGDVTEVERQR